jgi:hypothetical protein
MTAIRGIGNRGDPICVTLEWTCYTLTSGWIPNPNGVVPRARDNMTAIRGIGNRGDKGCVTLEWTCYALTSGWIPNPNGVVL